MYRYAVSWILSPLPTPSKAVNHNSQNYQAQQDHRCSLDDRHKLIIGTDLTRSLMTTNTRALTTTTMGIWVISLKTREKSLVSSQNRRKTLIKRYKVELSPAWIPRNKRRWPKPWTAWHTTSTYPRKLSMNSSERITALFVLRRRYSLRRGQINKTDATYSSNTWRKSGREN